MALKPKRLIAAGLLTLVATCLAQEQPYPRAKVSFDDFKQLVAEVEAHRAQRLVDLESFLRMSREPDTIILDTRSTFRYERIHLRGARHLSFTDFTQENLGRVVPAFDTRILIYCNNNFEGNPTDFASKVATPQSMSGRVITAQFNAQAKPLMMALNIPTYINLYGYGYQHVYELHELVDVNDPRLAWEGSIVAPPGIPAAAPAGGAPGSPAAAASGDDPGPLAPVPGELILEALALRGADPGQAQPVKWLDLPAHTPCGTFTTDAENAFLHAAAYARGAGPDRPAHARAATAILARWAAVNEGFSGPNGWLCAAWNLGSIARTAYVLKTRQAPEYEGIRETFEAWAVRTAESYLLPRDERRPLPGTRPQLLQPWETEHISNRTLAGLEAALHVARLTGDRRWQANIVERYQRLIRWRDFRAPRNEPGCGTTFFVNARGENNDHFRGDAWHRTAGLAAALQICEMVKADTGQDLFHLEENILRTSLEFYADTLAPDGGAPIPVWDIAARAFPDSERIIAMAVRQKTHERASSIGTILQYSWGMSDLLTLSGKQAGTGYPAKSTNPAPAEPSARPDDSPAAGSLSGQP